ncbi:hypothetical protein EGW08_013047, partial [Elysia chlorotica]
WFIYINLLKDAGELSLRPYKKHRFIACCDTCASGKLRQERQQLPRGTENNKEDDDRRNATSRVYNESLLVQESSADTTKSAQCTTKQQHQSMDASQGSRQNTERWGDHS